MYKELMDLIRDFEPTRRFLCEMLKKEAATTRWRGFDRANDPGTRARDFFRLDGRTLRHPRHGGRRRDARNDNENKNESENERKRREKKITKKKKQKETRKRKKKQNTFKHFSHDTVVLSARRCVNNCFILL